MLDVDQQREWDVRWAILKRYQQSIASRVSKGEVNDELTRAIHMLELRTSALLRSRPESSDAAADPWEEMAGIVRLVSDAA